jgi:rare lipoprotein A
MRRRLVGPALLLIVAGASACSVPPPEPPRRATGAGHVGLASWYGARFDGRRTASGERFDSNDLTTPAAARVVIE